MLTFLFWNLSRKPLTGLVRHVAVEHGVDVVIMAESNVAELPDFEFAPAQCEAVRVFTRFSPDLIKPVKESRHLRLPGRESLLVAAAHLPSKLYISAESQRTDQSVLARAIRGAEDVVGHSRTVLIGDLNANPFEPGVVGAGDLNAVMTRSLAQRPGRTVNGEKCPHFYNPMWGHFGDRSDRYSGTYYYDRGEHVTYYWNVFDQVMLRSALLDRFDSGDLQMVTEVGGLDLLTDEGVPDQNVASDHLPLVFRIDI